MTKGCVSESQFNAVREGMTKSEVLKIMGTPHQVDKDDDGESWTYYEWGLGQGCFVEFNEDEIVYAIWL
jgi:hypothetical protein